MKIIFATNTTPQVNAALNELRIQDRLLSYYYIKDMPAGFTAHFEEHGSGMQKSRKKRHVSPLDGDRTLWFHPESESYVECWGEEEVSKMVNGGFDGGLMVEVTGHDLHEQAYMDYRRGGLEDDIPF